MKVCNAEKAALHLKTEKGKVSLKNAVKRQSEKGYYRYGKGAYYILKQGAEKRNIDFQITPEQLSQWWKDNLDQCYYCGITEEEYRKIRNYITDYHGENWKIKRFKRFYRSSKHSAINWMTIDRHNNEGDYSVENIVKACWFCNSFKGDFLTAEETTALMKPIIKDLLTFVFGKSEI
jgi:hypothetical protein